MNTGPQDPLEQLLAVARKRQPSPDRLERVGRRLGMPASAISAALGVTFAKTAAAATALGIGTKVSLVLVAAGLGAAGATALTLDAPRTAAHSQPTTQPAPQAAAFRPAPSERAAEAPTARDQKAAAPAELNAAPASDTTPRARTGAAERAVTRSGPSLPTATSQPSPALPTSVVPGEELSAPPAATSSASVALAEQRLLLDARRALETRPAETLDLVTRHRQQFPQSAFAQEREVLAIKALKKLGRHADATRLEKGFVEAHPHSAYRRTLEDQRTPR
jgi:hypothetical protein